MGQWLAGAYLRLSKENRYGQKEVSDSVDNQKLIIEQYIRNNPDMILVSTYIDDGFTGLNYDREAFEKMRTDLEMGKINTIITKDLSRLGREQIQTLQLVTLSFVEQHIRYIAVNDGYDSYINPDTTTIEIKAFFNNFYSADSSKKVRAVQKAKREKGEFIGSFAPYGYLKASDNKNKLIVDEEAAVVVKKIFDLYIAGNGIQRIARILNEEKILPPTAYKQYKQGLSYKNGLKYETTRYWTYSTVKRILEHQVYIGNMVQHTSEKISYRSKKTRAVPKSERCIVDNTHEPILDKEKFDLVQNLMAVKYREMPVGNNITMYAGIFFCGDCGRRMAKNYTKANKEGIKVTVYKCGTYSQHGKMNCSAHYIRENDLDKIILEAIRENAVKALDEQSFDNIQKIALSKKRVESTELLKKYFGTKEQLKQRHERMLMNLSDGIITQQEFMMFTQKNTVENAEIDKRIAEVQERLRNESVYVDEYTQWVETFMRYRDISEIKREILVNLIERIEIYEDKHIEIQFRFKNPFE